MGGLDRPDAGELIAYGRSSAHFTEEDFDSYRNTCVGFIFQEYNLLDTLTARENIVLPLNLRRAGREYTRSALERVSGALGVGALLDKFPYELSGGERQRVACARAVITSPALILADEPTGALDSKNSRALMQLFCRMNAELGATILMVTHDAAVASYAGRALFLQDGKLFSQLYRGERDRADFQSEILSTVVATGGYGDAL